MILLDPNNPLHLIPATIASNPDAVIILPVFAPAHPEATLVLSAKKRSRRIPPELAEQLVRAQAASGNGERITPPTHLVVGRVLLTMPADVVDNLRGPASQRHPLYLFSVHRSVYDAAMRQADTGIVLPSESIIGGGSGAGIIKP